MVYHDKALHYYFSVARLSSVLVVPKYRVYKGAQEYTGCTTVYKVYNVNRRMSRYPYVTFLPILYKWQMKKITATLPCARVHPINVVLFTTKDCVLMLSKDEGTLVFSNVFWK